MGYYDIDPDLGDDLCFVCGEDVNDGCDCQECPVCGVVGEPSCYARGHLPYRKDSIHAFCEHVGIEPLSGAIRAIEKHNAEHVWLELADGTRTYFWESEKWAKRLDNAPFLRIVKYGVGGIAWDGTDWEYSITVDSLDRLDWAREQFNEALEEHYQMMRDEFGDDEV